MNKLKESREETKKQNWKKYASMDAASSPSDSGGTAAPGKSSESATSASCGVAPSKSPESEVGDFPDMLGASGLGVSQEAAEETKEHASKSDRQEEEAGHNETLRQALALVRDKGINPEEDKIAQGLKLLSKIVNNITAHPSEGKYRRLKLGNPALRSKLFSLNGSFELLLQLGFERRTDVTAGSKIERLAPPPGETAPAPQAGEDSLVLPEHAPLGCLAQFSAMLATPS